ncbi:sugar ABC transporter permease [Paenibacillus sp. J5C_2022]|uniref:carbohydrate ABC transporter permease n=1 Tax=Paenibacillus sp. J5C2022 TaxID=2977129 RepID=UPI0021D2A6A8|nr:sugar ABC transporter permease [Paenibacillus sp. J5C2022]MCU6710203.1 sugar ABC transporter permease [Paenibacillus sp. J5C2022]
MRRMKASTLRRLEGSLFIAPWVSGFLLFMAFPLGYSFYMSFHDVKVLADGIKMTFLGLENYQYILFTNGSVLYNDLIPFLQQALLMIPIIVIFSLLVAIMLNQKFKGRGLFRTIFFLPVIFSTGQIVNEFLTQGEGDLGFLERYNIAFYIREAVSPRLAEPIIGVMDSFVLVLWYSGVQILIFVAGRQTISASVYEAARIDGASPWETFWKITLPGMLPFIMLNTLYTIVDLFTFPTNPIITKVTNTHYGQSSALVWIYLVIILTFLGVVMLLFARLIKSYQSTHR